MAVECSVTVNSADESFSFTAEYNEPLFALLIKRGLIHHLETPCGGKGLCGKCLLRAVGRLSKMSAEERSLVGDELAEKGYRLACCCYIKGDCVITLPQRETRQEGSEPQPEDDYGFSVDLGTTTIQLSLHNLHTKQTVAIQEELNCQRALGFDVKSRIARWKTDPEQRTLLHGMLVSQLDSMIKAALEHAGVSPSSVSEVRAVGNTCLLHMLANVDVSPLASYPFEPLTKDNLTLSCKDAGLTALPSAQLDITGVISGFIGSDAVAAALVTGMYKSIMPVLQIDFGTNVEVLMGNRNVLLACSTDAASAFEGAGISCGMTHRNGAICKLWKEKYKVLYKTIGGTEPTGICGTALLEAIEIMLDVGIIDSTGRMRRPEELKPSKLRMIGTVNGEQVFFISRKHRIYITQNDIRAVQLAKAAVLTCVQTLFEQFDITGPDELSAVYLGGIFGGILSVKTAVNIGLLPAAAENICYGIGNAASQGAALLLHSPRARATAEHIRTYARTLHPENDEDFQERFTRAMEFRRF